MSRNPGTVTECMSIDFIYFCLYNIECSYPKSKSLLAYRDGTAFKLITVGNNSAFGESILIE